MPFREKLKKTFARRSSSNASNSQKDYDPSDRSCSLYYQPGEKIPYKYRRPVEPEHKAHLDSFAWTSAWKRRSHGSQYSPMGSRMPSRNNSATHGPFDGVRVSMGSLDDRSNDYSRSGSSASAVSHSMKMATSGQVRYHSDFDPNRLEPIQSVQTASRDELGNMGLEKQRTNGTPFSMNELDEALKRAGQTQPLVAA